MAVRHPPTCRLAPCLTIAQALALLLLSAGCALSRRPKPVVAAPAPSQINVGKIALVNAEEHFVLIDLGPYLYVPPPGAALHSVGAAGAIAHLRAAPEQKRPFIAAEILDGQPAAGDEVFLQ